MLSSLHELSILQKNILIASIIADGEITKLYPKSRRKNRSFREHYGIDQAGYRFWKAEKMNGLFYVRPKGGYLVSKSMPLFNMLYAYFCNTFGEKRVPKELFRYCKLPHFLAILYLDDGTLSISKRINHRKKLIYLTPHIYLYLQSFSQNDLKELQKHIVETFGFDFRISKRKDGYGYVLKLTKVNESLEFMNYVSSAVQDCISMKYKFDWHERFAAERQTLLLNYPDYFVECSNSDRFKNYQEDEITEMINLKVQGWNDQDIATKINRTYWSVVNKFSALRKDGRL